MLGVTTFVVSQKLSDDDVDQVASRVVPRGGLASALVIVATLYFGPAIIFPVLSTTQSLTKDLPTPVAVAITAAVIAVPLVAYVLVWGRRRLRQS
jgi:hypothetical protein